MQGQNRGRTFRFYGDGIERESRPIAMPPGRVGLRRLCDADETERRGGREEAAYEEGEVEVEPADG